MGVWIAKAIGFFLAYYASKNGASSGELLKFKVVEIKALLACEALVVFVLADWIAKMS
jgi:hypothetical protein